MRSLLKTRDNEVNPMASEANIKLPEDLLVQAQRIAAAEGKPADQLAAEALRKELARKMILSLPSQPSGMTEEEEVQSSVKAVHDYRRGR